MCSITHLVQTQLNSDHVSNSGDDAEGNSALRGNDDYDSHDDIWEVLIAIMMILNTDFIP